MSFGPCGILARTGSRVGTRRTLPRLDEKTQELHLVHLSCIISSLRERVRQGHPEHATATIAEGELTSPFGTPRSVLFGTSQSVLAKQTQPLASSSAVAVGALAFWTTTPQHLATHTSSNPRSLLQNSPHILELLDPSGSSPTACAHFPSSYYPQIRAVNSPSDVIASRPAQGGIRRYLQPLTSSDVIASGAQGGRRR